MRCRTLTKSEKLLTEKGYAILNSGNSIMLLCNQLWLCKAEKGALESFFLSVTVRVYKEQFVILAF